MSKARPKSGLDCVICAIFSTYNAFTSQCGIHMARKSVRKNGPGDRLFASTSRDVQSKSLDVLNVRYEFVHFGAGQSSGSTHG